MQCTHINFYFRTSTQHTCIHAVAYTHVYLGCRLWFWRWRVCDDRLFHGRVLKQSLEFCCQVCWAPKPAFLNLAVAHYVVEKRFVVQHPHERFYLFSNITVFSWGRSLKHSRWQNRAQNDILK